MARLRPLEENKTPSLGIKLSITEEEMSVNLVYETTHLSRISKWLDITDRLRARLIEANTQYYKLVAQEEQGRGLTR